MRKFKVISEAKNKKDESNYVDLGRAKTVGELIAILKKLPVKTTIDATDNEGGHGSPSLYMHYGILHIGT